MTFYRPILLIFLQMPRVFAVSVNEAVTALEMFSDTLFKDKNLPPYTSKVWQNINNCLNNKWNIHSVYINVCENTRRILTQIKLNLKIEDSVTASPPSHVLCCECFQRAPISTTWEIYSAHKTIRARTSRYYHSTDIRRLSLLPYMHQLFHEMVRSHPHGKPRSRDDH